jgi:hypothetical protein
MLLYHLARVSAAPVCLRILDENFPDSQPLSTRIDAIAADWFGNSQFKPLASDRRGREKGERPALGPMQGTKRRVYLGIDNHPLIAEGTYRVKMRATRCRTMTSLLCPPAAYIAIGPMLAQCNQLYAKENTDEYR